VLDCVTATAADADYFDDCTVFRRIVDDLKNCAFLSPVWISGIGNQVSGIRWREPDDA
jgi:hypothetical protein